MGLAAAWRLCHCRWCYVSEKSLPLTIYETFDRGPGYKNENRFRGIYRCYYAIPIESVAVKEVAQIYCDPLSVV
jgi:hypothetical protein